MDRKAYPTDLTDAQWMLLAPPGRRATGGPFSLRAGAAARADTLRVSCNGSEYAGVRLYRSSNISLVLPDSVRTKTSPHT